MTIGDSVINTSVDKLVALVNERERISFKEAAKKLAIPYASVEEWAKFLEEEDILVIEYKLMTPYLVKRQFSEKEKSDRIDSFNKEKMLFDKKLEAATSYFQELDDKIQDITKLVKILEGSMGSKLKDIEHELKALRDAEAQKEKLDHDILNAKQRSLDKIREIESHIQSEKISYKKALDSAMKDLYSNKKVVKQSEGFLKKIRSQETILKKRLQEINLIGKHIEEEISRREQLIDKTQDQIVTVKHKHDHLRNELEEEQKALQRLIQDNEEHEKAIENLQQTIYAKLEEEGKRISEKEKELEGLPHKFGELSKRKNQIIDILNVINHEEIELKEEINRLTKQAKVLQYSLGKADFEKQMHILTQQLNHVTDKRKFFKEKIGQLVKLMDWR